MGAVDGILLAIAVYAAIGVGLGIVLLLAGDRTRTSLAIGFSYVLVGPTFYLCADLAGTVGDGPEVLARLTVLLESGAVLTTATYVSGLATTSHATPAALARVRLTVRVIRLLGVALGLVGVIAPGLFLNDVALNVLNEGATARTGFGLLVPGFVVMTGLYMYAYFQLFRGELDRGERTRAICAFLASPLLIAAQLFTAHVLLVLGCSAMLTTFFGIYRHAVTQGERSAYLSRFLSPHVADQVRADGLNTVMRPDELTLTVVACDLRGFTSYADAVPSQAVIDLLGDYYSAVGEAVAEVDGTIKDYAGDGVLVLIGAPIPQAEHASHGVLLARRIHEVVRPVLDRWSTAVHPLGIGVGVASGKVTVGAIGSAARMEYTAVGTPVNLASRLCSIAADGETLLDRQTAQESGVTATRHDHLDIKGLSRDTAVFALRTGTAAISDVQP